MGKKEEIKRLEAELKAEEEEERMDKKLSELKKKKFQKSTVGKGMKILGKLLK